MGSRRPQVKALVLDASCAYDALYLELALRHRAQLGTFRRKLADAASSAGIPIFGDLS